jgi:hypothetical protein
MIEEGTHETKGDQTPVIVGDAGVGPVDGLFEKKEVTVTQNGRVDITVKDTTLGHGRRHGGFKAVLHSVCGGMHDERGGKVGCGGETNNLRPCGMHDRGCGCGTRRLISCFT